MGIIDVALKQEGIGEYPNGSNNNKFNTWYYGREVSGSAYAWCAVFVSWCANQAGVSTNVIPKTASVSSLYSFFKKTNSFHPKNSGYIPKVGDVMIQKSNGASHTGIVYAVDNNKFYTIEGNSSNKVVKRSYSFDDPMLTGFGSPNYSGNVSDNKYTGTTGSKEPISIIGTTPDDNPVTYISEPIQKKHTTSVDVSHPTIKVEFYTEKEALAAVSTSEGVTADKKLDNDIISLNIVRSLSQDCPTFTMNLVWRDNWFNNLSSNDLLIIKMQRPPEKMRVVFLGLIDDIRRTLDFSSGVPQRVVQVTGRGFNKAFINFEVGLIENLSVNTSTGFMTNLLNLEGVSSAEAIKLVLESYIGKAIKYTFGNGKCFEDYFQSKLSNHAGERLTDITSYVSYVGSLWNFIKELSNSPFNETFWEVEDGKPTLIHRETPFNPNNWNSLPRITITDDQISSDGIGRSDLETYTLYNVQSSHDEYLSSCYYPLWYKPFYAKYGITQLKVSTIYQMFDGDGIGTDSIKQFFIDLYNWNIKNNIFYNGNLTVRGKAEYKIGERVILESENLEFYVESVTQSFNMYQSWTTTLGLTRGIQPEERFTPPWDCYEEFTPEIMSAIINQTSGESIDWDNLPKITDTREVPITPVSVTTSGNTNGTTSENEQACYNYLTNVMGLNAAAAAAVLANINCESGFRTGAIGDGGTSLGLCQWHNGRMDNLKKFCRDNGLNVNSVEGQMAFLKHELSNSYPKVWDKLKNTPNTPQGAYDAAYYWCVHFEVPAHKEEKGAERGSLARKTYYPKYAK